MNFTAILKRLLVLAAAIGIGYYLYMLGQKPSESRPFGQYKLDELATTPLPKSAFLDGVRFYAEGLCKDKKFLAIVKSDKAACLAHVAARHSECLATVAATLPGHLADKEQIGAYSEQYLRCVTPQE